MSHVPKDIETVLREKYPGKTPKAIEIMLRAWNGIIKIEVLRRVGACKTINEILQIIQELK